MSKLPHLEGSRSFRCPKCKACIEEPRSNVYQCPVCSSFHLTSNGGSGHSRNLSSLSGSSDRNAIKNQEDNFNGREESFGGHSIAEKARLITEPSIRKEVPKGASSFTYSDSGIISPIWFSETGSSGHEPVPSMDKGSTLVHHNPRSLGSLSKLSRARVIRYDREDSIDNLYEDDNTDHEGYEIDYQEEHSPPDGSSYNDVNLISKQDFHSRISQRGTINRAERGSKDIRIDSLTVEPDEDFYMHDGLYGDRHKKDVEGLSAPSVTTPSEYVLERGETPRKAEMQGANDSPRSAALVWRGRREGSSDSQGPGHDSIEQQSVNRTPKSRRTRAVSTEIKRTTEGGDTQASTLVSKPDEISVVGQSSEISYHIQLPYQIFIPATVISSTSTHHVEQSTGPIRKAHVPDLRDPKVSPSSSTHESYVCISPQSQACSTPVIADIDADGRSKLGTVKPSEPSLRMPKSYPPLPCKGGPPYIMCKHCYKVLRVPLYLPPNAGLRQKLQCGECQKVSKFYVPIQAINLTSKSGNSSHDYLFTMSFRSDKSTHGLHHDDLFTSSFKSAKSTDSAAHGDLYKYSPQRFFEHIEPEQDDFSDASSSGSQTSLHEPYNKDNKEMASQPMESRQSSIAPGAPLIDHLTRSLRDLSPRSYRRLLLQTSMSKSTHLEDHGISVDATTKEPEYTTTTRSTSNASSLYHHIENPGQGNRSKMSITSSSTEDANKGGTSSYSGLLKALKDLRGGNSKVIVNGHTLKKEAIDLAQQKAGIIHPGTYWYDYKAGFWGVMGGPCQGIVMPSIEEFNFPLARDCSGGKTGICVNGRELHEKDLEVLSRRGLPKTYGKAYDVDILGNVTDTNTGQRLNTLRILAPSVLKKGRGCGMSPRT